MYEQSLMYPSLPYYSMLQYSMHSEKNAIDDGDEDDAGNDAAIDSVIRAFLWCWTNVRQPLEL